VVPRSAQDLLGRQIIAEELAGRGWTRSHLARSPKTDPAKVAIARRLRGETVLSLRWVAAELRAGSANTLRNALAVAASGASAHPALAPHATLASRRARAAPRGPVVVPEQLKTPAAPAAPEAAPFSVAWD
jgi:hypothetical protein